MKLFLAPMATLTHTALRQIIYSFGGCDEYYTEMIQAGTLLNNGPFEKYYLITDPEPEKLVWQLTGGKPEALIQATELLCRTGGIGVDINMGCCAPDIIRSGAGIAWMLKPLVETQEMLKGVAYEIKKVEKNHRFSVKIRLGDDDFTEKKFFSFIDMLAFVGVNQITLHPRTKKEKYRLAPRYEYVKKLVEYVKKNNYPINIILNGGISSKDSLDKALEVSSNVSGIMIGRGAVQKPWIFSQLKNLAPEKIDLLQTGLDFIHALEKYQPPEFYKTRLQRFFTYYSDNVQFSHFLRTKLLASPSPEGCKEVLTKYFDQCPEERMLFLK